MNKLFFNNLFASEEYRDYFKGFSKIIGFELSFYDEKGSLLFCANENPVCEAIRLSGHDSIKCPDSCMKYIIPRHRSNEPAIFTCDAKITGFSAVVEYLKEKAIIVGRNGFASYENYLKFQKIVKDNNIQGISITQPLHFTGENHITDISVHVYRTINYLLKNIQEKNMITDKFIKFASIANIQIFETLSKNSDSLYRYITDALQFILSPVSVMLLNPDAKTLTYKTASAAGRYMYNLAGFSIDSVNDIIRQIRTSKPPLILSVEEAGKYIVAAAFDKTDFFHFFPIIVGNAPESFIVVVGKKLSQEDITTTSSFIGFIEVFVKNQALRCDPDKKLEDTLISVSNISMAIAPVLNYNLLLQTILEKSVNLLEAEQGSLMLLDHETNELRVEVKKSSVKTLNENISIRKGDKIAWKVLESGDPLLVKDVETDPRISRKNNPCYRTKSFLSIPITIDDRVAGVLNFSDKSTGEFFTENDLKLMQFFALNAALAIERSSFYKKYEEAEALSITDPLTGIMNRRYMDSKLIEEVSRHSRHKHPFSFLIIDIDDFKKYNDTYGHSTGDTLLKSLASALARSLRNIDMVARYGGDEFVIIFPQTPKGEAIHIANRLRENVANFYMKNGQLPQEKLTISMGLASYPDDASSIPELFEKTDQALYLAKKRGRNGLGYL